MRIGEFLIGCGAAVELRLEEPWWLANGRYWIPSAIVILMCLQRVDHGLDFLCLHEEAQHSGCTVWPAGQAWVENKPPCITVLEKILNKYALIYGVARAELEGEEGWGSRFLFRFFSGFSPTLYLGHENMNMIVKGLGELVGWDKREWRDDTTLFAVYISCFALDCSMKTVFTRLKRPVKQAYGLEEGVELLDLQANDIREINLEQES